MVEWFNKANVYFKFIQLCAYFIVPYMLIVIRFIASIDLTIIYNGIKICFLGAYFRLHSCESKIYVFFFTTNLIKHPDGIHKINSTNINAFLSMSICYHKTKKKS